MEKKKIIIAEDENIIALDLKKKLENLGFLVPNIVNTGDMAIKFAAIIRPNLILMDITLKGKLNGIDAGIEIWKRYKIPIIYITAYIDDISIKKCIKFKCNFDYLIKPIDNDDFTNKIAHALVA